MAAAPPIAVPGVKVAEESPACAGALPACFVPPANAYRHKARLIAALDARQDRAFRLRVGFGHDPADISRRIDRAAVHIQNNVAALETAFSGAAVGEGRQTISV